MKRRKRQPIPVGNAREVHDAGHVGRHQRLRAARRVVGETISAHLRRDRGLGDSEASTKAATLVGSRELCERQTADGLEQRTHLVRGRRLNLTRTRKTKPTKSVTSNVQCDSVRETNVQSSNGVEANLVVEERAKLRRTLGDSPAGVQFHVHRAARGEHDDAIVGVVCAIEPRERPLGVVRESRICRWLTATRRVVWNRNAQTKTLEHTQRRDRNMWIELIHKARNKERDARHAIRS
jgi:hypothetical protein